MAYCTEADLLKQISEKQLTQLTDDKQSGWIDQAVLADLITAAGAEIDSYAYHQGYPLPFDPVPGIIRDKAVAIVLYRAHQRRGLKMDKDHPRRIAYEETVSWLVKLSKGLASLGAATPAPAAADLPQATTDPTDRVFTTGKGSAGSSGSLDDY